jgi:adenylyltransferase/sulfurtransferase
MKVITEYQPSFAKQRSMREKWLSGFGVALVLGSVAAVFAVRHNPDLLKPLIQNGVSLEWAENWPVVGSAIREAETPRISVQQLKQLIDSKKTDYLLVDVRDFEEYKLSKIPGSVRVPLTEIEQGAGIDKIKALLNGRYLIAYCTQNYRSGVALSKLRHAGIRGIGLQGGIKAWTEEIDPSLPRNNW